MAFPYTKTPRPLPTPEGAWRPPPERAPPPDEPWGRAAFSYTKTRPRPFDCLFLETETSPLAPRTGCTRRGFCRQESRPPPKLETDPRKRTSFPPPVVRLGGGPVFPLPCAPRGGSLISGGLPARPRTNGSVRAPVRQPMQGWSIDVSALALVAVLVPLLRVLVRRLRRLHVVSPLVTAAAEFEPSEPAPSTAPLKPTRAARELPAAPTSDAPSRPCARTATRPPAPPTSSIREKARRSPPKPRRSGKRRSIQR